MVRLRRPSLLVSVSVVLVASAAPLVAQRVEVNARRAPRTDSGMGHATERQLRELERRADSLTQVYNDADEMSVAERRRVGDVLDRAVEQIEQLSMRLAEMDVGALVGNGGVRVQIAPMAGDEARAFMNRALTESRGVMPRGWLGIVVSGAAREPRVENGELIIRYLTHPAIISVEPSSPAERAGLTPSDTLIAFNGRDVRNADISITRLLRPNQRVMVRIRRDGHTRDVPVTIADVPSRIMLRREMNVDMAPPRVAVGLPKGVVFPRTPMAPRPPSAMSRARPMPPMPASAPMPAIVYGFGVNGVAGAQLVAITEGLGRMLGMRRGVLVANAPMGSPAYESGLRDGDVLVKAAGQQLRTVGELRERVAMSADNGEHALVLELVRARRVRSATLRW